MMEIRVVERIQMREMEEEEILKVMALLRNISNGTAGKITVPPFLTLGPLVTANGQPICPTNKKMVQMLRQILSVHQRHYKTIQHLRMARISSQRVKYQLGVVLPLKTMTMAIAGGVYLLVTLGIVLLLIILVINH